MDISYQNDIEINLETEYGGIQTQGSEADEAMTARNMIERDSNVALTTKMRRIKSVATDDRKTADQSIKQRSGTFMSSDRGSIFNNLEIY